MASKKKAAKKKAKKPVKGLTTEVEAGSIPKPEAMDSIVTQGPKPKVTAPNSYVAKDDKQNYAAQEKNNNYQSPPKQESSFDAQGLKDSIDKLFSDYD